MKKIIIAVLSPLQLLATNYYLSSAGSDLNNGISSGLAWRTIEKVNSFKNSFNDGDSLLLRCGDTFTGGLIFNRAVKVGWYGIGAKPVISGLTTITGWSNLGGNIWEASTTGVKAGNNLVLRNNLPQQVGRYPNSNAVNSGYITNTSTTNTSITGSSNSAAINWTGAELVYRLNRWTTERRMITTHSGLVMSFASASSTPVPQFGYFFQRDSRTLDQDGEWWQDGNNNKLRMYFSNDNPLAYLIQASITDTLLTGPNNVSVDGIIFKGAGKTAINFSGRSGIEISNCDIYNSGEEAMLLWFCTDVHIDNCTVTNNLGGGIRVFSTSVLSTKVNINVTNNTVRNTAYLSGMEKSSEHCGGIEARGGNTVNVLFNKVVNSGYNGIEWYGDTVMVKYNFVDSSCVMRGDGAGIYTWIASSGEPPFLNKHRFVVSNIILNSIGQNNGTNSNSFETSAQGLYADGASRFTNYDSNSVAFINGNGFHGNGNTDNKIRVNTFFNCNASISLQRFAGSNSMRNMTVTKNIFSPYRFRYRNLSADIPALTTNSDILAIGVLDSNYYSTNDSIDTSLSTVTTNANGSGYSENYRSFSYIKGTIGQEIHSSSIPNTGSFYYNSLKTPFVTSLNGHIKHDSDGNNYVGAIILQPFTSVVLFDDGPIPITGGLFFMEF